MQPFLLSQYFSLKRSFREEQCLQEDSLTLLLAFLCQSHLLCWGFASLVHLVLPYSVFYIFTLFCIYICFLQYSLLQYVLWTIAWSQTQLYFKALFCCLNCSALHCILQSNVKCCDALHCSLQLFHCNLSTFLNLLFYSLDTVYRIIPVLNIWITNQILQLA